MAKKRDPLGLSAHWHMDCRLEAELPEDNVVGTRFLVNTLFGSAALISLVVSGWLAYRSVSLSYGIRRWEQQIADNSAVVEEVKRNQKEYNDEAAKIERAAALIKTPFLVTDLVSKFGSFRPPNMIIESIEWNENGVFVDGTAPSNVVFYSFFDALRKDAEIIAIFPEVKQMVWASSRTDPSRYTFSVRLRNPRPPTPPQ